MNNPILHRHPATHRRRSPSTTLPPTPPTRPSVPNRAPAGSFSASGGFHSSAGFVNSQATALSGVPNIINAHRNAAILFSGLGFVSTIVSIVMFIRHRDSFGFLVAIIFLFFATGAAVCLIGFARH
jgi:hypothetical protein